MVMMEKETFDMSKLKTLNLKARPLYSHYQDSF